MLPVSSALVLCVYVVCVLACVCACVFVGAKLLYNNVINIINEQYVVSIHKEVLQPSAWKDRKVVTVLILLILPDTPA